MFLSSVPLASELENAASSSKEPVGGIWIFKCMPSCEKENLLKKLEAASGKPAIICLPLLVVQSVFCMWNRRVLLICANTIFAKFYSVNSQWTVRVCLAMEWDFHACSIVKAIELVFQWNEILILDAQQERLPEGCGTFRLFFRWLKGTVYLLPCPTFSAKSNLQFHNSRGEWSYATFSKERWKFRGRWGVRIKKKKATKLLWSWSWVVIFCLLGF